MEDAASEASRKRRFGQELFQVDAAALHAPLGGGLHPGGATLLPPPSKKAALSPDPCGGLLWRPPQPPWEAVASTSGRLGPKTWPPEGGAASVPPLAGGLRGKGGKARVAPPVAGGPFRSSRVAAAHAAAEGYGVDAQVRVTYPNTSTYFDVKTYNT